MRPHADDVHGDRIDRPPSGYEEFLPESPASALERVTQRWRIDAALSRRAVLALLVLSLIAVGSALVLLRDRPEPVTAEAVTAVSPAASGGSGESAGAGDPGGTAPEPARPQEDLVVHVGGEVAEPGLYTVPPGSRVADAVEEAGGALPDADLDTLNLARPLVDGEQVLVGVPQSADTGGAPGTPVDINRADAAALTALPRIGEVIAAEIVAHRAANGPFASVDDLVEVNGIGERTLETLRPHVTAG
ncbi:helix-hairpin-helix domain-containing protein [Nocardiopsis sp. NPDC050513]|uniref:helix-hairpin-helix domain-containing protein n=1 Tax=Nocardiopsis sp. NPDC050513 TaxID=3364338 RepID=UPI0037BA2136